MRGSCCLPPSEDARLLLKIVERHRRTLEFGLDERFPAADWGFTARQAVEKLLKYWIVLADQEAPRYHELAELAELADHPLPAILLGLQPFAVETRYRDGDFPLPAERATILREIQELMQRFQTDLEMDQVNG